jgi:hypothetical protein
MSLATPHEPEALSGARVSADFFCVLGVSPARVRSFLPEEDQPDAADVAIVRDGFWQSHFAAYDDVLPEPLIDAIRGQVTEIDPTLSLYGIRNMENVVSGSLAQPRLISLITGGFAGFTLLLAAIGI